MVKKIDVTQHVLTPKFSKLSPDEIKNLLVAYNISDVQLPAILVKDPLAKAANLKGGDVIKIERKTSTGKSDYYRRVV
ncbi:MAG: DNA-directed RNA polymerase subunit H [DPANN group archaeon]|nr:DNA-directed RNA polymerase subunit H [DPANN group archaeon]